MLSSFSMCCYESSLPLLIITTKLSRGATISPEGATLSQHSTTVAPAFKSPPKCHFDRPTGVEKPQHFAGARNAHAVPGSSHIASPSKMRGFLHSRRSVEMTLWEAGFVSTTLQLPSRTEAALGFHQVDQNIVDASEVPVALGTQPTEHLRIETDTDRHFSFGVAQLYQS